MKHSQQVFADHYDFKIYVTLERWCSIHYQLSELHPFVGKPILEVGPGPGLLTASARRIGHTIETLDIADDLGPDHVGDVCNLSFDDNTFEAACAFQVLEHLPYPDALQALSELVRVSRSHVVISLPDVKRNLRFFTNLFGRRGRRIFLFDPMHRPKAHKFDGEHYWEINKKGSEIDKILRDVAGIAEIEKHYRPFECPAYHFIILKKFGN